MSVIELVHHKAFPRPHHFNRSTEPTGAGILLHENVGNEGAVDVFVQGNFTILRPDGVQETVLTPVELVAPGTIIEIGGVYSPPPPGVAAGEYDVLAQLLWSTVFPPSILAPSTKAFGFRVVD